MERDFRFNLEEIAGAVGDYGTLIPIIIGVAAVTEIKIGPVLFFFGLSYIFTGLYYKLPMPVEPMKAVGTLAIAGVLTASQIAGAGILMGIILLLIGVTGGIDYIKKVIPHWLIRGVQLGMALILLRTALRFIIGDWVIGLISIGIVLFFTFAPILDFSGLLIFGLGLIIGIHNQGMIPVYHFSWPAFTWPAPADFWQGFLNGVLPQLPMTLGNAVLATSLLITDLLERKVPESKLVNSMGLMCIIASPFGGFPMCHGSGGLAAQYRFGARTGGSNIISGVILLLAAFFFASPELVNIIPYGVLGALLFFSASQLLQSAVKTNNRLYTGITGVIALLVGMAPAFITMFIFSLFERFYLKKDTGQSTKDF